MGRFFRIALAAFIAFYFYCGMPLRANAGGSGSIDAYQANIIAAAGNMTYVGSVNLFMNAPGDNRITVNNTTTFAGGWVVSNSNPTIVINDSPSGRVLLAGSIALEKPMTVPTVTMDLSGSLPNPAETFLAGADGTLENGVDETLPTTGAVNVGGATGGLVNYDLSGHNQTISLSSLSDPIIVSGGTITLTSTGEEYVPNLAGRVTLVPEPSTMVLSICGIAAVALLHRRKRSRTD